MSFPTRYSKNSKRPKTPKSPDMSGLKKAAKAIDKAAPEVFRQVTKDHANTDTYLLLIDKPTSGFWAHVWYAIKCFLVPIGVSLVRSLLIIVLYLIWIPILFLLALFFLRH